MGAERLLLQPEHAYLVSTLRRRDRTYDAPAAASNRRSAAATPAGANSGLAGPPRWTAGAPADWL